MTAPVLLATWPFARAPVDAAWPALAAGGAALDAACSVCRDIERDASVDSVGWGGLPDEDGRVTLDALVMLGPDRLGAVGALARHPDAVDVARRVLEASPHALLVGPGADAFADAQGFREAPLLAPAARARFEARDGGAGTAAHDTICALALGADGTLAGATSTSGAAWKHPGRVGDSPVPGAGLYVLPGVGAAAATGLGELALGSCASFVAVEELRRGASPGAAVDAALARARAARPEGATDQLALILLAADGAVAAGQLESDFVALARGGADAGPTRGIVVRPAPSLDDPTPR